MAQDRIHTKDGRVIECKVSDSSNRAGNVFFFPADDPETSHFIPVTQVDYLEIGDARVVRTPNDKLKPAERRFYIQRMGSFYFVRGGLGVNVYTASIQTDAGESREGLAAPVVSLALGLDFRVSRNLYLEVAARYIGDFASWNFGYDSDPCSLTRAFSAGSLSDCVSDGAVRRRTCQVVTKYAASSRRIFYSRFCYLRGHSPTSMSRMSAPSMTSRTAVRTLWNPYSPAAPGLTCSRS